MKTNLKNVRYACLILIVLFLVASTAQARGKGDSENRNAANAKKDSPQARQVQQNARSGQPADKQQIRTSQSRSDRGSPNPNPAIERGNGKAIVNQQPRTIKIDSPKPQVNPPAVQARSENAAQRSQAQNKVVNKIERPQVAPAPVKNPAQAAKIPTDRQPATGIVQSFVRRTELPKPAPSVKNKVAAKTQHENIVQPITKKIEKPKKTNAPISVDRPIANATKQKNKPAIGPGANNKKPQEKITAAIAKSAPIKNKPVSVAKPVQQKIKTAAVNSVANRDAKNNSMNNSSNAGINRISKNISAQVASKNPTAKSSTTQLITQRNERRERIIRGTEEKEVAVPNTGKFKSAEKAINSVDTRTSRTTVRNNTTVINNKTIVRDFDGRGGRDFDNRRYDRDEHDRNRHDHDGRWWNRHDDRHSNVFVSFNFSSYYNPWTPAVYEPVYTPVYYPIIVEPVYATPVAYTAVTYSNRCRPIVYHHGHRREVAYCYSDYHRRYVFVSVGGFWPDYSYARYYWYGYHPWYWYGAVPVAYPVTADNYNYYTYDNANNNASNGALEPGTVVNGVEVPDYDALHAAGGRQIDIPPAEPPAQAPIPVPPLPGAEKPNMATESDRLFEEGVKAFGDANYPAAIEKFQRAVRLEPNDVILPFAYAQALFANNNYEQAAAVIYTALNSMAPAKPEVFFPRGLYKDDNVLTGQIKNLEKAVLMNPSNSELQLLYGYQLLGTGKLDQAKVSLEAAKRDARTAGPATSLLNLIEEVKKQETK